MKVDFDTQIFSAQEFGGISRYFASVCETMRGEFSVDARVIAPLHFNAYLKALPQEARVGWHIPRPPMLSSLVRLASMGLGAPVHCARRADILHETYYFPFSTPSLARRRVTTVYDMIHERRPDSFPTHDPVRNWKRKTVARADHVICISEYTRRDLLDIYGLAPERVSVVHLGYDSLQRHLDGEPGESFRRRAFGADEPYILFVGQRGGYKNFSALLKAYAGSAWLRENFRLLCFGGGAFSTAERDELARLGVTARVCQRGGADKELASCYRHAALFVYPSAYEGFGIPPLEAMSLDCPLACSNATSIPEVAGAAAAYFAPHDLDAIRDTLETVLGSAQRMQDLVEQGRVQRERFSWKQCAGKMLEIYRQL
ncbi:MAG: glycosyltransferase family 1 protein [Candidatus Dactylopiibacterium sp.]|nr:glycosyltransferase family 1 protein [Candidatus Dactylopiibacterium sp.]